MEQIQRDEVIKIVHHATDQVFSTMLNMKAEPQPAHAEPPDQQPVNGVIGIVGIGGTLTGAGRVCCSSEMACTLAGALLMSEYEKVDDDVLDAIAEVTNMIIGNVKTTLEETHGSLSLGVPTVIYGRNYQARTSSVPAWTVVPFRCGEETMEIRFTLMPTPNTPRPTAAARPEAAPVPAPAPAPTPAMM